MSPGEHERPTRLTPSVFLSFAGVEDWSVDDSGTSAHARFTTWTFARGVALVQEIGTLADAANHHPDVDLRYSSVEVRLTTHDAGGLTHRDVHLAQGISRAARDVGAAPTTP